MQMQPATSVRAPGVQPRPPARPAPARSAPARVRVRRTRLLALLLVAASLLMVAPGLARGDGPERPVARVTYTVQAGDTLWVIARRAAPERDPREVVDELIRDNRLQGQLHPGQQLSLPATGQRR
jgi:Tfp pilus assembly protein FimV